MKRKPNVRPNPERIGKREEIKLEAEVREEIKRATKELFDECGGRELTAAIKAALLTVEVFNIEMAERKKLLESGKKTEDELPKMIVSPSQGIRAAGLLSRLARESRELLDVCTERVYRAMESMMESPSQACAVPAAPQLGGIPAAQRPELVTVP
ncbi:MAG: hypothetical protein OEY63_05595 [Gemmatimonadota bacterium]|nr:hypothetical protein [Gemmatimonadota bacterium]